MISCPECVAMSDSLTSPQYQCQHIECHVINSILISGNVCCLIYFSSYTLMLLNLSYSLRIMRLVKANSSLLSYFRFPCLGNKTLKLKKKHSTDGDHIIIINIQIKIITVKHTHLRKLAQAKNLLNKVC